MLASLDVPPPGTPLSQVAGAPKDRSADKHEEKSAEKPEMRAETIDPDEEEKEDVNKEE